MANENVPEKLEKIREQAQKTIHSVRDSKSLQNFHNQYLGRKSELTSILRMLKDFSIEEKRKFGTEANELRKEIDQLMKTKQKEIGGAAKGSEFDVTEPGMDYPVGSLHPITQIQNQLEDVFKRMGFMVLDGPQLESDYFNFQALNTPEHHPARDMQDTFWTKDGNLLRTQTSPVQVRGMLEHGVPIRAVVPGRVYRNERTDVKHDNTFYQLEGLMVDENITISNLIATMQTLLEGIFPDEDIKIRLRPGYFPFVEPAFELDMYTNLLSKDKNKYQWLELLPCGMVHPEVLRSGNADPAKYSGFAFGLGMTRLAMLKFGISDIRLLLSGDLRFLRQF
ncbi:phenylalanine--tRNA ligase subunit alpha [Patescibacteria group bacterium]